MRLESTVKRWPGYVILPDAFTYPQLVAYRDALDAIPDGTPWATAYVDPHLARHVVAAICALVTEWHLSNFPEQPTVDTFPATPRVASVRLVALIGNRLYDIANETDDDKKKEGDSPPASTAT